MAPVAFMALLGTSMNAVVASAAFTAPRGRNGRGGDALGGDAFGGDAGLLQPDSPQGSLLTRCLVTAECLLVTPAPSPSQPPVATAAPGHPLPWGAAPGRAATGSWEHPAPGEGPRYLKPQPLIRGSQDNCRAEFKAKLYVLHLQMLSDASRHSFTPFPAVERAEVSSAVVGDGFGPGGIWKNPST